jgi:hypothetical protein
MFLRDVEYSKIAESIIEASAKLPAWPGDGYDGECDVFQAPERGQMPRCAGLCKHGGDSCYLATVAWEGPHEGLYYVAVFCTSQSKDKLDHWVQHVNGELLHF